MSEIAKYEAYKKKLQGICEENDLTFRFRHDIYPITLTIKPVIGFDQQLSMLENVEEKGYTSPNASIVFTFKDGAITYKTSETFTIGDALFTKIKNLFKNMHYCWLQYFFRDIIERKILSAPQMPAIDEDEADDTDGLLDGAEPIEELDGESIDDELGDFDIINGITENEPTDEEIDEATRIVRVENKASTSLLQRRMNINFEKASRIIEALEENGVVGPYNDGQPREVLPCDMPADEEDGTNE